jgi:hypothetical protein
MKQHSRYIPTVYVQYCMLKTYVYAGCTSDLIFISRNVYIRKIVFIDVSLSLSLSLSFYISFSPLSPKQTEKSYWFGVHSVVLFLSIRTVTLLQCRASSSPTEWIIWFSLSFTSHHHHYCIGSSRLTLLIPVIVGSFHLTFPFLLLWVLFLNPFRPYCFFWVLSLKLTHSCRCRSSFLTLSILSIVGSFHITLLIRIIVGSFHLTFPLLLLQVLFLNPFHPYCCIGSFHLSLPIPIVVGPLS